MLKYIGQLKRCMGWLKNLALLQKIVIPIEIVIAALSSTIDLFPGYRGFTDLLFLILLPMTLNWKKSKKSYIIFGAMGGFIFALLSFMELFYWEWYILEFIVKFMPPKIKTPLLFEGHPSPLSILLIPFWVVVGIILSYFVGRWKKK